MILSRFVKWAAAGVLALGTIPAIGMARSQASLPTSAITVTPTSMALPAATHTSGKVTRTKLVHSHKTSLHHHTAVRHTRVHLHHTTAHSRRLASHHTRKASMHRHHARSHKSVRSA